MRIFIRRSIIYCHEINRRQLKKALPLALIITGYLGYLFFGNYRGQLIPFPGLFYVLSIVVALVGVILLLAMIWIKEDPKIAPDVQASIDRLKKSGEQILLNFDDCNFKGSDYQQETDDESNALGYLAIGSYYALLDKKLTEQPNQSSQSALVYSHRTKDGVERFQSPIYPFSEIGLKALVLKGDLILYADRLDRKNFYFDLKN